MCVVIEAIWHLYGTSVKKHDVVYELEPSVKYSQVEFVVYLDRKPLYFVVNIIVPCCLLIAISLLVRLSHSRPLYYSAPNRPPPHTHPHRRLDFGAYGSSTLTSSAENFWPRHWSWRAEYCDERVCVCVCVCLSTILSPELHVGSSLHFCACYLWPWLGPPLMAYGYVTYYWFYG